MPTSILLKASQLLGALLLALAGAQALAQSDPPGRVGRLGFADGAISFAPADSNDWGPAEFNRPLTSGDRLQTAPGARAELHSGSTALRLAGQTALEISELDDNNTRLTLTQGTLALRVRNLYPGERLEIDTPNLAFTVSQPGEYRLDVDPNYRTTGITVRSGSGVAYGENGAARPIGSPQQIRFADRQLAQEVAQNNPPRDSFDLWSLARDRSEDQSLSARYVSRDTIGYQQLDSYGDWRTDTVYGPVWFPRVGVDQWAPYRYGQWRWVAPWGWTWVDDAPWGFAPFHYGRWTQIGVRWAWIPGPVAQRPVYAPALVRFPEERGNVWQDHRRPPSSGWIPLGPRETWRPSYQANPQPARPFFNNRPDRQDRQDRFDRQDHQDRPNQQDRDRPNPLLPQAPAIGVSPRPGWRNDEQPRAGQPHPRPEMRMPEASVPMAPARNLGELEQRANMQRQQQAERERQQQEQVRNQVQAQQAQREQMQREATQQQQMRELQQRQQQMQHEQAQREQQQREQQQQQQREAQSQIQSPFQHSRTPNPPRQEQAQPAQRPPQQEQRGPAPEPGQNIWKRLRPGEERNP